MASLLFMINITSAVYVVVVCLRSQKLCLFCGSIQILECYFSSSMKNVSGILIALNE
jgi:hypothetical protein